MAEGVDPEALDNPYFEVTGMVIEVRPIGEYDRRVVLLTRERGKISAFAKSARKPTAPLHGTTDLFAFGTFRLFAGKSSYTLTEASILNYFESFRTDIEGAMYGAYFCEVLEYATRENNDEALLLLLAYQSLRALESKTFPDRFVRAVFEIKLICLEGEYPGLPKEESVSPACIKAVDTIANASIGKLYSFLLDEKAERELEGVARSMMHRAFGPHIFKSLLVLESMGIGEDKKT
ncbi:MAG: DNA repair protein RecO [Lachnospiraceae bacterium]|jgi:DNA repair protein RecO (recombination protein O)|nr:DNA repair protein RecO [Lachnospiraceae bacterium]MCI1397964.1 DNA repair protein RecO [Lachnospiraceae bacterium]MCI1423883.1 DNA repair protein RecO [Lachnospiraceae bacterium]MCI1452748.1 DNA repair protein RecO [Lachnospiraceae bacterium]